MKFLFNKKIYNENSNNCCICMEKLNKNISYIKCNICINTIICETCELNMLENGQLSKCPVCRSDDEWFNKQTTPEKPKNICITKYIKNNTDDNDNVNNDNVNNDNVNNDNVNNDNVNNDNVNNDNVNNDNVNNDYYYLLIKNIIKKILYYVEQCFKCIGIIIFIWCIGALTMLLIHDKFLNDMNAFMFVMIFIIGFIIIIFTCECMRKCLYSNNEIQ